MRGTNGGGAGREDFCQDFDHFLHGSQHPGGGIGSRQEHDVGQELVLHVGPGQSADAVGRQVRSGEADGDAALLGDDGGDADRVAAQAQAQQGKQVPDRARRVAVAVLELVLDALDIVHFADRRELLVHQDALGLTGDVDAGDEGIEWERGIGQLELHLHRLTLHLIDGLRKQLRVQVEADGGDRPGLGRAKKVARAAYLQVAQSDLIAAAQVLELAQGAQALLGHFA